MGFGGLSKQPRLPPEILAFSSVSVVFSSYIVISKSIKKSISGAHPHAFSNLVRSRTLKKNNEIWGSPKTT